MTLRKWLKYRLYGAVGSFPYCGTRVHFPPAAVGFKVACEQGIFEADNVRILLGICRADTCMFDVGGNLGLMAIPVLKSAVGCSVVSFEPSPNSLPSLRRTIAGAGFGNRWRLVEKAAGAKAGSAEFSLSSFGEGVYDGLKSTGRAAEVAKVTVEVTTLDTEWKKLGCPPVSAIKIDVEGSELAVIEGAAECLKATRPTIMIEWNAKNLAAYDIEPEALFGTIKSIGYSLYALPFLVEIETRSELKLHMLGTESFLLVPLHGSETLPC
jgi:FkbM family methyltransferase